MGTGMTLGFFWCHSNESPEQNKVSSVEVCRCAKVLVMHLVMPWTPEYATDGAEKKIWLFFCELIHLISGITRHAPWDTCKRHTGCPKHRAVVAFRMAKNTSLQALSWCSGRRCLSQRFSPTLYKHQHTTRITPGTSGITECVCVSNAALVE